MLESQLENGSSLIDGGETPDSRTTGEGRIGNFHVFYVVVFRERFSYPSIVIDPLFLLSKKKRKRLYVGIRHS